MIEHNIVWKPRYTYEAKTKSQLMTQITANKIYTITSGGKGFSYNGYTSNTRYSHRSDATRNVYFYICWKHENKWFAEVYTIESDNNLFKSIKQGLRDFEFDPLSNVTVKLKTNRMN
jgi:hypothetical protein